MTTREARFGLIAFALLMAGLAMNLLALQGPAPAGAQRAKVERGQPMAGDRSRRLALPPVEATTLAAASTAAAVAKAAMAQDSDSVETIRAVQRELQLRGYETGSADGVPGLMTRAAIMAFEHDHGLSLTGEANEEALKRILLGGPLEGAMALPATTEQRTGVEAVIRTVQQTLSGLGYNTGKVDGKLGEDTQRAIRDFEIDSKLPETGRISGTLIARLAKAAGNGRLPGTR